MLLPETEDTDYEVKVNNQRYYALIIVGILLPLLLSPFLASNFLSASQSLTYRLVVSRFLIWGELGLMVLYARYAEVQSFVLWEEERYNFLFYLLSIIGLYFLAIVAGFVSAIPHLFGFHQKNELALQMKQVMDQYPLLLVFTAFTAGVTEEIVFRSYMIPRLSLLFKNKNWPVIISALLFSYVHLGYKNLAEIIFTFLFGLIFGFYYKKYRNIKALVIVHILWDVLVNLPTHHH